MLVRPKPDAAARRGSHMFGGGGSSGRGSVTSKQTSKVVPAEATSSVGAKRKAVGEAAAAEREG